MHLNIRRETIVLCLKKTSSVPRDDNKLTVKSVYILFQW